MKGIIIGALFAISASALPEFAISKSSGHKRAASTLSKRNTKSSAQRRDPIDASLEQNFVWTTYGLYYINVTVGTPPQLQSLFVTTQDSNSILYSASSDFCTSSPPPCQGGSFNPGDSSSYELLEASPAFNESYGDGSQFVGAIASDTFTVGDLVISGVNFVLAESIEDAASPQTGFLGLGYSVTGYPTLVDILADSGAIPSRVYSIYLGGGQHEDGNLLFGGLDTTRYTGPLTQCNLLPTPGSDESEVSYLYTTLTKASLTVDGQTYPLWPGGSQNVGTFANTSSVPVYLSHGYAGWDLPPAYYSRVKDLAFPFVDSNGLCSCKDVDSNVYFSLTFAATTTTTVSASNLFTTWISNTTGKPIPYGDSGDDTCIFLIYPEDTSDVSYLGQPVLRTMYVIYDLDNKQATLAQAASSSNLAPNIVEVQAGPNGVADAAGARIAATPSNTYTVPTVVDTVSHHLSTIAPSTTDTPSSTGPGTVTVTSTATSRSQTNDAAMATGTVEAIAAIAFVGVAAWNVLA